MVRVFFTSLILLSGFFNVLTADVNLSVELEGRVQKNEEPINGKIIVVHDSDKEIDTDNVMIGGASLKVEVVSKEPTSPTISTTTLKFTLPGKEHGLQVLPAITVNVGGKAYQTVPQTYIVDGVTIPSGTKSKNSPAGNIWLRLESFVDGKKTLLPGQKTKVGYRYIYNGNIQTKTEELPLLDAEGFKKIGEMQVSDYKEQNYAVRQVAQEIEALKAGEYQFADAKVTGNAYYTDRSGQRIEVNPPVEATASGITITVQDFPSGTKPQSFNGAIGKFTNFNVQMLSLPQLSVGDKVTLSIEITGKGNLEDVPIPEVCCQPGFSGNFKMSDIPPVGITKGDTRYFVVDLRPLSDKIDKIPSLEFTYFDPDAGKYISLNSKPIPIKVYPSDSTFSKPLDEAEKKYPPLKSEPIPKSWPVPTSEPQAIEIKGNKPLSSSDLYNITFGTWWTLLLIPLSLVFLWYQAQYKKYLLSKQKAEKETNSEAWITKAANAGQDFSLFNHAINKGLISLLWEQNLIPSADITPQALPDKGIIGKVRTFLCSIDEQRFTGRGALSTQDTLRKAQELYREIKAERVHAENQ